MEQISGTGTTFRATHSFVAILTNNPELQKRLQQEVDEAVGDETPRLADKEKMPYMEAVRGLKIIRIHVDLGSSCIRHFHLLWNEMSKHQHQIKLISYLYLNTDFHISDDV